MIRQIEKLTGSLWTYRGRRIKPPMIHLVRKRAITIAVIAFCMIGGSLMGLGLLLLGGKPNRWLIATSLLVAILLTFVVLRFLREKYAFLYERMYQKQQIARLIESQGFIQKQTKGETKRESIVYYPKVYYRIVDHYLHIRFPLDASKHQDKYLQLQESLEISLYAEMTDRLFEKGYVLYEFLYDMSQQRLSIDDVVCKQGRMRLMKNVWWEYDKTPHMLLAGGTGGGKSATRSCLKRSRTLSIMNEI